MDSFYIEKFNQIMVETDCGFSIKESLHELSIEDLQTALKALQGFDTHAIFGKGMRDISNTIKEKNFKHLKDLVAGAILTAESITYQIQSKQLEKSIHLRIKYAKILKYYNVDHLKPF